MIKIIVDAMGGDNAPEEIVKGAVQALAKDKDLQVVLTGDEGKISPVLAALAYDKARLQVVHCTEVITNDDAPTLAIRQKKDSSLVVALKMLKEDEGAQGFVSAGSTGAVLTGALLRVGRIRGVSRPAVCPALPTAKGGKVLIIDAGANAECKPVNLCHFALMGTAYAKASGVKQPRVGLVTKHIPVSEISRSISKEKIVHDLHTLRRSLIEDFGIVEPRIAVMALNPHAGDGGLLGHEEQEIIRPAIVEAFSKGVLAFGPFAADGLFAGGGYAKYDGILAMYHDQGLAPFKTLSPDGVNFTAGLAKVRTSPDHGTAYDIAGQDKADAQSMRSAIYAAIDIVEHRRAWTEWSRNPLQRAEREKGGRDISVKDLPQTERED